MPEFKQQVVETMRNEKLSYRETARHFGVVRSRIAMEVQRRGIHLNHKTVQHLMKELGLSSAW